MAFIGLVGAMLLLYIGLVAVAFVAVAAAHTVLRAAIFLGWVE